MRYKSCWVIIILLVVCGNVSGQGLFKKLLNKDGNTETVLDTLAITVPQGMQFYPCAVSGDKWIVLGKADFPGVSSEQLFVNALLYTIEQAESGKKHILRLDINERSFSVLMLLPSRFYPESKTYYKFANTLTVTGNHVSFISSEMHVCSSNLFGDPKEIPFEKLQPEKKGKHKNYVNEMAAENSAYLDELFCFVKKNTPLPVVHWQEIAERNIVKGMNETECLLAVGKPQYIRKTGNQTKWMVNNDFVVMFENGIVVRTIR